MVASIRELLPFCTLSCFTLAYTGIAHAEHKIKVIGSSTVYLFAIKVAEQFARMTGYQAPLEESTGTGEGFQRFCQGKGNKHPDIINASRRISGSEIENCSANGVADIVEIKIGYDGITLANARKTLFLA